MRFKLFILLLVLLTITYFTRENYRFVDDIVPEVMQEPVQTDVLDKNPVQFEKNGFSYTANPLFEYDISGLVVHRQTYNQWWSLSRTDTVFPMDLCVIWGDNIKSGAYKKRGTSFSQDYRFCLYRYNEGYAILNEALSNNHLVIKDDDLYKIAQSIRTGDQIRIRGKLVDVEAKPLSKPEKYEPENLIWKTSIMRTDSGAGACETIFVESIEILKIGNPISSLLFTLSYYGVIILIIWFLLDLMILRI